MKINEILKKENVGKRYKVENSIFEVVFKNGSLTLSSSDEWVILSDFYLNADFEEVKNDSGWLNERGKELYYFTINSHDEIRIFPFDRDSSDMDSIESYNAFTTSKKAEEVAREQLLYRKMKKFRDENDKEVNWEGDCCQNKYYVTYNHYTNEFEIRSANGIQDLHTIYFTTRELAQRCLEEVVKPHFGIKEQV